MEGRFREDPQPDTLPFASDLSRVYRETAQHAPERHSSGNGDFFSYDGNTVDQQTTAPTVKRYVRITGAPSPPGATRVGAYPWVSVTENQNGGFTDNPAGPHGDYTGSPLFEASGDTTDYTSGGTILTVIVEATLSRTLDHWIFNKPQSSGAAAVALVESQTPQTGTALYNANLQVYNPATNAYTAGASIYVFNPDLSMPALGYYEVANFGITFNNIPVYVTTQNPYAAGPAGISQGNPGIMSTAAQNVAGQKTFFNGVRAGPLFGVLPPGYGPAQGNFFYSDNSAWGNFGLGVSVGAQSANYAALTLLGGLGLQLIFATNQGLAGTLTLETAALQYSDQNGITTNLLDTVVDGGTF